jgi:putative colanic acid biosynthesis glycosyltransferase WcaI
MRIAVLGINYWPDETGIAPFTTGRCEYLAARGHEVTVFTGFPYYPAWRVLEPYRGRLFSREVRNGVTILRSWAYVPRRVNSIRRILHEASFTASACMRALAHRRMSRPDVILAVSPPLTLGLAAATLGAVWKVPYVLHVTDLQPDAAADLGMLPRGRVMDLLYALERLAYRRAAAVSTLTEAIAGRIVDKGVPRDKMILFRDWADPSLFEIPLGAGGWSWRQEFGLDGQLLVVHAGNMGVKQGLEVIVGAAELSRDDAGIMYLLVGDGAVRPALEGEAGKRALPNVRFVPLLPSVQFRGLLAAADLCLVTQKRSVADIVFPSKVPALLAAGRPIVASLSAGSEVARVIEEAGAGVRVEAENPAALVDAVHRLRADPRRRRAMAADGRAYARTHWNKDRVLPSVESELVRVVNESPQHAARFAQDDSRFYRRYT